MAPDGLTGLDRDLFTWVVGHRVGILDWPFLALTAAGQAALLWIALAPLLARWAGRPVLETTLVTAATVWAADLTTVLLKAVFDRARPYEVVPAADPLLRWDVSSSFPSGHAATSAAGVVVLTYLLGRGARVGVALAVLAAAVAYSRVYVGVHYPSDVVAGAAAGVLVALVAVLVLRRLRPTSAGRRRSARATPEG